MSSQPAILGVKVLLPVEVGPAFRRVLVEDALSASPRVTAVIGAAGFGKTTAVALWAAQVDESVAWLTVDPTDNVPGIHGVGVKTAAKLIEKYGTADAVIAHADEQTPKLRENLLAGADGLALTRRLAPNLRTENRELRTGN